MNFSKIAVWLPIVLMIIGSQNAKGQNKIVPQLESTFIVDACTEDNKKEILVLLKIGEVKKTDSLFGFNFEIKYDPSKIRFDNVIWQNTLSEFFDTKQSTIRPDEKAIYGTAGHLDPSKPPVSGNLALVALYGVMKTDCPDSSLLEISYLEFTEEFKKVVDTFQNTKVYSIVSPKPERKLEMTFNIDSLFFNSDSLAEIELSLNHGDNRLTSTEFLLEIDNEDFWIDDIISSDPNCIIETADIENGKSVALTNNANDCKVNIKIKNKGTAGEYESSLRIKSVKVGNCDCISHITTDTLNLRSLIINDTVSVGEDLHFELIRLGENLRLRFDSSNPKLITVSDILGRALLEINSIKEEEIISFDSFSEGFYLISIESNGSKKIVKHIKY